MTAGRRVGARLGRYPVTLVLLVTTVALSITAHLLDNGRHARMIGLLGIDPDAVFRQGRWFAPFTAGYVSIGIVSTLVTIAAVAILIGWSERLLGSARTVVAVLATGLIGFGGGIVVQQALLGSSESWVHHVHGQAVFGALVPIVGTIMAASVVAGALWRRRIRVVGFAVVLVFALYSGSPVDLYALLAAVGGLAIGPVLARRRPVLRFVTSSVDETRTLLATLVAVGAAGPIVTLLSPRHLGPLAPLGELFRPSLPRMRAEGVCLGTAMTRGCLHELAAARIVGPGPVLLTLLPLITLMIAAWGIRRGRRLALLLAIGVNLVMAALAAFYYGFLPGTGDDDVIDLWQARRFEHLVVLVIAIGVPLAIAAILVGLRRRVEVRSDPRRVRLAAIAVLGTLAGVSLVYLALGVLSPGGFAPSVTVGTLLLDLPERFVPVGFLSVERISFLPISPVASLVYLWMGPLTWSVLVIGVLAALRAPRAEAVPGAVEAYRALRRAGGGGSLGHMGVWEGNGHWVAADGGAAVAYRVVNGYAIALSEPVCRADRRASAIRGFSQHCAEQGWSPVLYAVHDDTVDVVSGMGWTSMRIGEEAVLATAGWTLTGKARQDLRTSVNRAARAGIRAEWTDWSTLSIGQRTQITAISEDWVADAGLPEMGFTLGGVAELADADTRLCLAIADDGRIDAVTSWMPTWRDDGAGPVLDGWTLDVMRRRDGSMNGVMEFVITETVLRAAAAGVRYVSLSTAPFASTGEASGSPAQRVQSRIGDALEPYYRFRSLLRFKAKFFPEYQPMSMAFPDPLALPGIAAALVRAYLPELSISDSVRLLRAGSEEAKV